jgi:hypothetical protein
MLLESMGKLFSELQTKLNAKLTESFVVNSTSSVTWPADAILVVTSGFRNPERNERVGGKTGSRHMLGRALDVAIHGVEDEDKEIAYFILWEILKDGLPATADYVQYETKGTAMIKKFNTAESNSDLWVSDNEIHASNGIADGFLDVDHLHLQDNP